MKKKVLFAATLLLGMFIMNQATAQDVKQDVKGTNYLNAGIGLGSYGLAGTGGLPITASFEHGISKNISAGVTAGMIKRTYAGDIKYTYLITGVRGSYHFNELLKVENPKVDLYGGLSLFYRHYSFKYTYLSGGDETEHGDTYKSAGGNVDFAIHAGARYLFANNVGAYAELGYGISPLQLGLTFKF